VLYIIDDAAKLVTVTRVAHRREVYEYTIGIEFRGFRSLPLKLP
jgi:hypothetical protein